MLTQSTIENWEKLLKQRKEITLLLSNLNIKANETSSRTESGKSESTCRSAVAVVWVLATQTIIELGNTSFSHFMSTFIGDISM